MQCNVDIDFTFLNKEFGEESSFSKFTNWFNPMFLFNTSELKWCNHYIYSKINRFTEKIRLINKWKASLEVQINHLLTLQICEPKRKSYFLKDLLRKISTNSSHFSFINFRKLQKIYFSRTLTFANQAKIFISGTSIFENWAKTYIWHAYHLVKMANNRETYFDFCDVERYSTVTWTCQYSTSAFKERFKTQTLNVFLCNKTKNL